MLKVNPPKQPIIGPFLPVAGAAVLLACASLATPASAEGSSPIESRGYVSLGAFLNESDLTIRLDGSAGENGTEIDWGKTFGDTGQTRFRLDGLWRITDRHHLRV
ncbi:MAG TPA: hypothetical protein VLA38_01550, partial [Steroidobacteraceae bacterium]|nr:hypothetical protein [Steroidobacteraceae bacterium]